jgi:TfdA family taurine catabolism dioxygenase TauD
VTSTPTSTPASGGPVPEKVPGGWVGSELAESPESWRVPLPAEVRAELLRVAADMLSAGLGADDPFQQRPVVSAQTRSLIAELSRRLAGAPGFVVLSDFPVQEDPELVQAAYWVLGLLLGQPLPQDFTGELIARVENIGRDKSLPGNQGFRQSIALPYHIDRCTDVIGLVCVRPAQHGGLSRLISSRQLHNELLAQRPDLLSVLYRPLPFRTPRSMMWLSEDCEVPEWVEIPVFSRNGDDQFAGHYVRRFFEGSQDLPDAPRLTPEQLAAFDALDEVLDRPELTLEMVMEAGDVQLVNNLHVLHSRTSYDDDAPAGQGRLLLRIHLAFPGSPELPAGFAPMFGATAAGTYRGGMRWTRDVLDRFGTPLEPVS